MGRAIDLNFLFTKTSKIKSISAVEGSRGRRPSVMGKERPVSPDHALDCPDFLLGFNVHRHRSSVTSQLPTVDCLCFRSQSWFEHDSTGIYNSLQGSPRRLLRAVAVRTAIKLPPICAGIRIFLVTRVLLDYGSAVTASSFDNAKL